MLVFADNPASCVLSVFIVIHVQSPTVTPPAEKQRRCLHTPLASRDWLLDSTGHRDFLLRRIVLKFWYQHWTFIRELSWSSAHDYLAVFAREAGPHTQVKSWPRSPVREWPEDTLHSLGPEECQLLGSKETPGTRPEEDCCLPSRLVLQFCGVTEDGDVRVQGYHTEAVTKGRVRSVFSTMWKRPFYSHHN